MVKSNTVQILRIVTVVIEEVEYRKLKLATGIILKWKVEGSSIWFQHLLQL